MVTSRNPLIFCLLLTWLSLISCASPAKDPLSRNQTLSGEEQNVKTLDALQELSRLSGDPRKTMRAREAAYIDLINKYPDSQWAYECYNRLMLIYLTEYAPPAFDKAEAVRERFVKKYAGSSAGNLLDDTLADAYHRNGEWTKLIKLYTTSIKRFVELWNVIRPRDMFLYAEAKFHLGDRDEARKGYNIIIFYFPNSPESTPARNRLEEITGLSQNMQTQGLNGRPLNRVQTIDPPQKAPLTAEVKVNALSGDTSLKILTPENPVVETAAVAKTVAAADTAASVEKLPLPDTPKGSFYSVQLGFFGNEKNAHSLSAKLKTKGYDVFVVKHGSGDNKIYFRVLAGRFQDRAEALEFATILLRREGMKSIIFERHRE